MEAIFFADLYIPKRIAMKNLKHLTLLAFLFFFLSCSKDNVKEIQSNSELLKPSSADINLIKRYLATVKSELDFNGKNRLDTVQNRLLWDLAKISVKVGEQSIVEIPIQEGAITALFYYNTTSKHVDSSIICFVPENLIFSKPSNILEFQAQSIKSLTQPVIASKFEKPIFSIKNGDIKTYSIDNVFKKLYHFENGKLLFTKDIRSEQKTTSGGISSKSTCWAWYWATTYPDGSETWEYMYTICDCGEQINSIDLRLAKEVVIKNNCASGGTVSNPQPDPPPCAITPEEADNILTSFQVSALLSSNSSIAGSSIYDPINDILLEPVVITKTSIFRVQTYATGIIGLQIGEWDAKFDGTRYKESPYSAYATWKWEKIRFSGLKENSILTTSSCVSLSADAICAPIVLSTDKKRATVVLDITGKMTVTCFNFTRKSKSGYTYVTEYLDADF